MAEISQSFRNKHLSVARGSCNEQSFVLRFSYSQMEVFTTNQRIFSWLCICPLPKNANKSVWFIQILTTGFFVLLEMLSLVASAGFLYDNVRIDVINSLNGLLQLSALGTAACSFIIIFIFRRKINEIFASIQRIYDGECSWNKIEIFNISKIEIFNIGNF